MANNFTTDLAAAMRGEYVEDFVLRRYVWRNYTHALTKRERALYRAAALEIQARHASNDEMAVKIRRVEGYFYDPDVGEIAERGLDFFEARCCERLLKDYGNQIYVNRCERCRRIVASPIACACRWCGHQWYERRAQMLERSRSLIYPTIHALTK
jgi:hypothetical protein